MAEIKVSITGLKETRKFSSIKSKKAERNSAGEEKRGERDGQFMRGNSYSLIVS